MKAMKTKVRLVVWIMPNRHKQYQQEAYAHQDFLSHTFLFYRFYFFVLCLFDIYKSKRKQWRGQIFICRLYEMFQLVYEIKSGCLKACLARHPLTMFLFPQYLSLSHYLPISDGVLFNIKVDGHLYYG